MLIEMVRLAEPRGDDSAEAPAGAINQSVSQSVDRSINQSIISEAMTPRRRLREWVPIQRCAGQQRKRRINE